MVVYHGNCEQQQIYKLELKAVMARLQHTLNLTGGNAKIWVEVDSKLCLGRISGKYKPVWDLGGSYLT